MGKSLFIFLNVQGRIWESKKQEWPAMVHFSKPNALESKVEESWLAKAIYNMIISQNLKRESTMRKVLVFCEFGLDWYLDWQLECLTFYTDKCGMKEMRECICQVEPRN